ncbi:hypothetical protein C8R41DRAFT_917698 [Lentinula lateritia]|uniref:Uncharacterized protein n=1 Tax=Lentinula lateritia TaxID=40482 RepID=A0ABQ8VLR4_9AGAR|nr:hypothetical protein C8R41DRAFT_917698 [Lentinula lateritia]
MPRPRRDAPDKNRFNPGVGHTWSFFNLFTAPQPHTVQPNQSLCEIWRSRDIPPVFFTTDSVFNHSISKRKIEIFHEIPSSPVQTPPPSLFAMGIYTKSDSFPGTCRHRGEEARRLAWVMAFQQALLGTVQMCLAPRPSRDHNCFESAAGLQLLMSQPLLLLVLHMVVNLLLLQSVCAHLSPVPKKPENVPASWASPENNANVPHTFPLHGSVC